jgi:hypothetical protein
MLRVTIVGLGFLGLALATGCGGASAKPADGGARDTSAGHDGGAGAPGGAGGARDGSPGDGAAGTGGSAVQSYALKVTAVDTTFVTEDHFIAAVEMQLAGVLTGVVP